MSVHVSHVLLKPGACGMTCYHGEDEWRSCPVCDGGLAVCAVCRKLDELDWYIGYELDGPGNESRNAVVLDAALTRARVALAEIDGEGGKCPRNVLTAGYPPAIPTMTVATSPDA